MNKHCVNWKEIRARNVRGAEYSSRFPDTLDAFSKGTLLSQILTMENKTAISFEEAVKMVMKKNQMPFRLGGSDTNPRSTFGIIGTSSSGYPR